MIFDAGGLGLGVDHVNGAVKIGRVRGVDLAGSFGDVEFIGRVGGIEDAEILAVGGASKHQKSTRLGALLCLARLDKKDATLKIISFDFFDIHQSLLCECS